VWNYSSEGSLLWPSIGEELWGLPGQGLLQPELHSQQLSW